ncbi:MAG TPA: 5'-3' exonuclease H3TH domain-containing protein [Polyangiaceae bacterium]|jgi:DNA polymerase-1|nr:5'-3' exonuclease H3TH domain-containing protein [Polyangiaceae bacterium]
MTVTLLIDTSSVVFRAHHALPPMNTRAGVPTAALYGTSVLLLKLLREERPKALAFALDAPKATFRHERLESYKGTRQPLPDPLRPQLARLPDLLAAFGAPSHQAPGFEADDVLATLARRLSEVGEAVRIVTGDRDMFQLIRAGVDVMFIGRRGEKPIIYDAAAVEKRFGVAPDRLPFLIALVGDKSDNLPGVPGIGPRSGAKLVATAASAADLVARAQDISSATLRAAIVGAAEQIRLTEELARLRSDVELADGVMVGAVTKAAVPRLRAFFEEFEFKSLLPRLDALEPTLPDAVT